MKIRRYLLFGAAALVLIASFLLPNAVAGITDSRRLDNLVLIDSQSVSFDSVPELSLPDRIALVANKNTELLAVTTSNTMNFGAAERRAVRELTRFFRDGPFELDCHELTVEEGAATLIIDTAVPTNNMIIWELTLVDPSDNSVTVTIDDEIGVILKIIYRRGRRSPDSADTGNMTPPAPTDEELYSAALSLTKMMVDYYGLPIELADYEFSGSVSFYKAYLSGGGEVIPMFGVVRANSFTMNERVNERT